jgi:hypothetical protein
MDRSFSAKFEFSLDRGKQTAAFEEWTANHSGPLSFHGSSNTILFQKDETIQRTDAFKALNEERQKFLRRPDVSMFETITVSLYLPTKEFSILMLSSVWSSHSSKLRHDARPVIHKSHSHRFEPTVAWIRYATIEGCSWQTSYRSGLLDTPLRYACHNGCCASRAKTDED